MALLDAYADRDAYREATNEKTTGESTQLDNDLIAASRMVERALGLSPGAFNTVSSATYTFDGHGGTRFWLRDGEGRGYWLQDVDADGIGIDSERDATYDGYALDFADAWVVGYPRNASAGSEPYKALDILPRMSGAQPTSWPDWPAAIQVTGDWGWAAVPEPIVDLTIHWARELRQHHRGSTDAELPALEGMIPLFKQATPWIWKTIERTYGRKVPAIA